MSELAWAIVLIAIAGIVAAGIAMIILRSLGGRP